jgi:hypothetical protein
MRHQADVGGGEGRETAWLALDEARRRLGFEESRAVLARAQARVRSAG